MGRRMGISDALEALLLFVGLPLLLYVTGIGCPIKFATGISCPGCGMTRAWLSALSLRFDLAFAYHPLFWAPVPLVGVVLLRNRIPWRLYVGVMASCLAALLVVWALRMFFPAQWDILVPNADVGRVVGVDMPRWLALFVNRKW